MGADGDKIVGLQLFASSFYCGHDASEIGPFSSELNTNFVLFE